MFMFTSLRLHAFCAGGFEQKIGKCLYQALEIRRRRPLGTVMFQIQSELHRNAAFPFLSHGLSPSSEDEIVRPVPDSGRAASEPRQAHSGRQCRPELGQATCLRSSSHQTSNSGFAAMATPLL